MRSKIINFKENPMCNTKIQYLMKHTLYGLRTPSIYLIDIFLADVSLVLHGGLYEGLKDASYSTIQILIRAFP